MIRDAVKRIERRWVRARKGSKQKKKKKASEGDWRRKVNASDDGEEGNGGDRCELIVRRMEKKWARA